MRQGIVIREQLVYFDSLDGFMCRHGVLVAGFLRDLVV